MQKIEIDDFSGPIDLLLTLVQHEELSLTRINLIEVLEQIISGLEKTDDLNQSGDIIMIIGTLLELKSKLLLPGDVNISEEIQALKDDLLSKILIHRRLNQVLEALESRFQRRLKMHGRPVQLDKVEEVLLPMDRQNPFLLYTSIKGMVEEARHDSYRVDYLILPIEHYFEWLDQLVSGRSFSIMEMAGRRRDRLDFAGVLVAILELVRQGRLAMELKGDDVFFHWKAAEAEQLATVFGHHEN